MALWKIAGGTVHDPANGVDGLIRDVWIDGGKIVAAPRDPAVRPAKTLDAAGRIVMAGGIDMHSHLAGPKVTAARKLRPEDRRPEDRRSAPPPGARGGTSGSVPSSFATGRLYAGLGITTAFDAAVPALFARHAHAELADTPIIDKGFLALAGNHHYVLERIAAGDAAGLDGFVAWLLGAVQAYGLKAMNPGGIEEWKEGGRRALADLDAPIRHFNVTPRQIVAGLAASADRVGLPHPLHLHCNNLGAPGNEKITAATIDALQGCRGHLAHVQFHSYADDPAQPGQMKSATARLVELLRTRPELSVDVGHVTFGNTTAITGDGPLGHFLHRVTGGKWFSADAELETGCGVVPIEYRPDSLTHSVQWAVGLEWYLLHDPWRMALSTDHPNGGSFLSYPQTLRLLMSRDARREALAGCHRLLPTRCDLPDLDKEYTLQDVATITRAAPAKLLGLPHKGHLGVGADADVAVYDRQADIAAMFALPRWVVKAGEIVLDDGELRAEPIGLTHRAAPRETAAPPEFRRWFAERSTVRLDSYALAPGELPAGVAVPCVTVSPGGGLPPRPGESPATPP